MRESFETTTESDRPVPRKKEFSLKAGLERKVGFSLNNEVKGLTSATWVDKMIQGKNVVR